MFTFGRSVHSSFTHALSEGRARLDFRRPENREFWLAAWRYTNDLGQRGTWRTSYEWAKLILSLDPEGDPYCISRRLDQLALRGGQSEHYLRLNKTVFFGQDLWKDLPNTIISTSLAQYRLKEPQVRNFQSHCYLYQGFSWRTTSPEIGLASANVISGYSRTFDIPFACLELCNAVFSSLKAGQYYCIIWLTPISALGLPSYSQQSRIYLSLDL